MMLTKAAVERLNAIQPHRETTEWRERAAQEALNVLLLSAQPAVADAYRRALARCDA